MNDSEKPFACTTEGCNMSFVNEDHLTVHKKKHDMMLNLGINNKSNLFIVDQTPTPTRFIRNCEEVGLFQDLQHENPFDETFRRAVEAGKNSILTVAEVDHNDDLHTPSVFPHIMDECSSSIAATSSKNEVSKLETLKVTNDLNTPNILPHIEDENHDTTSSTTVSATYQVRKLVTKNVKDSSTIIQTLTSKDITLEDDVKINEENSRINISNDLKENIIIHTTSDSTSDNNAIKMETEVPITPAEMQFLLKTQDGKVLRFVAAPVIKNHLDSLSPQDKEHNKMKIKSVGNSCDKIISTTNQCQKLSAAKLKLKEALSKNGTVSKTKSIQINQNENHIIEISNEQNNTNTSNPKKQAILERNRASSMRSRAKRKAWIQELQHSLKLSNETNANLQDQVKCLQSQVEKLKSLLLIHKDCPITKAMEIGNGIVVGSKVLSVKPNKMKQVAVVTNSSKSSKRSYMEKPIIPKKKPVIIATKKNPIILPKSDVNTNTITLHGSDSIKSISTISIVAPFAPNVQSGNTILKLPIIADTFSLNQNSPSKITGT